MSWPGNLRHSAREISPGAVLWREEKGRASVRIINLIQCNSEKNIPVQMVPARRRLIDPVPFLGSAFSSPHRRNLSNIMRNFYYDHLTRFLTFPEPPSPPKSKTIMTRFQEQIPWVVRLYFGRNKLSTMTIWEDKRERISFQYHSRVFMVNKFRVTYSKHVYSYSPTYTYEM